MNTGKYLTSSTTVLLRGSFSSVLQMAKTSLLYFRVWKIQLCPQPSEPDPSQRPSSNCSKLGQKFWCTSGWCKAVPSKQRSTTRDHSRKQTGVISFCWLHYPLDFNQCYNSALRAKCLNSDWQRLWNLWKQGFLTKKQKKKILTSSDHEVYTKSSIK